MDYSVAIIGGGPSGHMCAITAAKRGKRVVIIDHRNDVGSKILASGGGRCNFSNLNMGPGYFISENPHFVKSAISRLTPSDFMEMLKAHRIPYVEEGEGKLFCRRTSADILEMLKAEALSANVTFLCRRKVLSVDRKEKFTVTTDKGKIECASLVIATGGLSYPSLGASSLGYKIATHFGIDLIGTSPALVPILFDKEDKDNFSSLSGISFAGKVSCGKKSFTDDILITHRGLSGPAILQISSYWHEGKSITIDLLPGISIADQLIKKRSESGKKLIKNFLGEYLPKGLAQKWCEINGLDEKVATLTNERIDEISSKLHQWQLTPCGTEGYEKAEATLGGVDTSEISSKTMESKKVAGLYFVGELLDVTGHLGGYNIHWAFASGLAAGEYS